MKTCFFIGHHDAPLSIQEQLNKTVVQMINSYDVSEFIVGYHGTFDQMATAAVQKAKRSYPEIYAYRLLCYHPAECAVATPEFFDDTYYPEALWGTPRRFAIEKANRFALQESDYLIAYVRRDGGNAGKILRFGRSLEKKGYLSIVNLADTDTNSRC